MEPGYRLIFFSQLEYDRIHLFNRKFYPLQFIIVKYRLTPKERFKSRQLGLEIAASEEYPLPESNGSEASCS